MLKSSTTLSTALPSSTNPFIEKIRFRPAIGLILFGLKLYALLEKLSPPTANCVSTVMITSGTPKIRVARIINQKP